MAISHKVQFPVGSCSCAAPDWDRPLVDEPHHTVGVPDGALDGHGRVIVDDPIGSRTFLRRGQTKIYRDTRRILIWCLARDDGLSDICIGLCCPLLAGRNGWDKLAIKVFAIKMIGIRGPAEPVAVDPRGKFLIMLLRILDYVSDSDKRSLHWPDREDIFGFLSASARL
jgi:hypothetical protein